MNNIFESKEPIGEWMDKHFKSLKYIMVACPPTERFEAFRNKVREWLHQHDHSKEVEIRALYDELHSLKRECETAAGEGMKMLEEMEYIDEQRKKDIREADIKFGSQDPKASEVLSEWQPIKTAPRDGTRLLAYFTEGFSSDRHSVISWHEFQGEWVTWPGLITVKPTYWMPLPSVQALEEQLKEGE